MQSVQSQARQNMTTNPELTKAFKGILCKEEESLHHKSKRKNEFH